MINPISPAEIENQISTQLGVNLHLELSNVYTFKLNEVIYYATSSTELPSTYPALILAIQKNEMILLPSILPFIRSIETLITKKKKDLEELSHGNSISYVIQDGIYLIADVTGRRVALVEANNNMLIPIVDLGLYLRIESS